MREHTYYFCSFASRNLPQKKKRKHRSFLKYSAATSSTQAVPFLKAPLRSPSAVVRDLRLLIQIMLNYHKILYTYLFTVRRFADKSSWLLLLYYIRCRLKSISPYFWCWRTDELNILSNCYSMREKIQKKSALFVSCGGFSLVVGVITCKLIQSTVYNYTKQKKNRIWQRGICTLLNCLFWRRHAICCNGRIFLLNRAVHLEVQRAHFLQAWRSSIPYILYSYIGSDIKLREKIIHLRDLPVLRDESRYQTRSGIRRHVPDVSLQKYDALIIPSVTFINSL